MRMRVRMGLMVDILGVLQGESKTCAYAWSNEQKWYDLFLLVLFSLLLLALLLFAGVGICRCGGPLKECERSGTYGFDFDRQTAPAMWSRMSFGGGSDPNKKKRLR